ncbi:MAG: hypothetical protein RSE41_02265 [Clostridia bacterium]
MFNNILGHKKNIDIFVNAINNNTLSHAYLFIGDNGIGKRTFALELTKLILKVSNLKGNVDFKYICKKDDKKNIAIEDIREQVVNDIYIKPFNNSKKVYIIDDFETCSISAFNSLLKTLEEPPTYAIIILLSKNISTIPATIMSRVSKIYFSKISDELVYEFIEKNYNIKIDNEKLKFANGSIGVAVDILDIDFEKIHILYSYIINKDVVNALLLKDSIDFNSKYMLDYLEYLFENNSKFNCVELVEYSKERLKLNGNYDIVIDNMIIKCCR